MLETIYVVAGWVLLAAGFALACWGWRDAAKGSRRCPGCWYDMSATAGMKCPECGRESKTEKQLHRTKRRWRFVLAGLLCVLMAYPVSRVSRVQKDGVAGFLPRIVVLAAWPELIEPPVGKKMPAAWWRFDQAILQQNLESMLGTEMSALEARAVVWSSIRAIKGGGPNARAAQEAIRILGPEMGDEGARVLVDLWLAGKLRNRGPGSGSCVFMELPGDGGAFVDEVVAKVRADPGVLERDPYIVEWVLARRGSIAELIEPLDAVLSNADPRKADGFYLQLGTLPFNAEDAARTARIIRFEKKMGPMKLSTTLPQSGAASRFVADYREALTEKGGNRVSPALVGVAMAGPSLKELTPEVEALLQHPREEIRFQAKVALAMMNGRSGEVQTEVFEIAEHETWTPEGSGPDGTIADARKRVAVAALCSGAWPADIACGKLITGARFVGSQALWAMQRQGIEFILMNAEQTRKHADALNDAIAANWILATVIGRRAHMYPAADAIAPGLERAAEASKSQFQKRVLRGQAAEARRHARAGVNP